jgi:hypothetical protein
LKAWDELKHTQRWERLKRVRQLCDDLRVPYTAVAPHTAPPSSLIHLTKAKRVVIRSVDDIAIAGERRITQLKHELAVGHGTATSAFTHEGMTAAYLPDPLRFINTIAASSAFLAIGGDSGGDIARITGMHSSSWRILASPASQVTHPRTQQSGVCCSRSYSRSNCRTNEWCS